MRESQFSYEYSWEDLKPVRPLSGCILVAQVLGGVAGLAAYEGQSWVENVWMGGALASLPGYLVGLWVQAVTMPGSLGRNRVLVRRLGWLAAFFSAFALAFPWLD